MRAETLVDELEHIGKWPREHWKLAFQGQIRAVSEHDADVLLHACAHRSPRAHERAAGGGARAAPAGWGALDADSRLAALAALGLFVTMLLPWYEQNAFARARGAGEPEPDRVRGVLVRRGGRPAGGAGGAGAAVRARRGAGVPPARRRRGGRDGGRRVGRVLLVWRLFDKPGISAARHGRRPVGDLLRARSRRAADLRRLAHAARAAARAAVASGAAAPRPGTPPAPPRRHDRDARAAAGATAPPAAAEAPRSS